MYLPPSVAVFLLQLLLLAPFAIAFLVHYWVGVKYVKQANQEYVSYRCNNNNNKFICIAPYI